MSVRSSLCQKSWRIWLALAFCLTLLLSTFLYTPSSAHASPRDDAAVCKSEGGSWNSTTQTCTLNGWSWGRTVF